MIKLGVKKIEFRVDANYVWRELKIVSLSASLTEEWNEDAAGKYSTVKITAEIRNSSKQIDIFLKYLSGWDYQYQITDMNDRQYLIGNNEYRADFNYSRSFGDLKTNGYEISIEYKNPEGITASH
ncbi:MAG: hypothetical protein LBS69_12270 [Prevotellaceae bacterium]|jgi:hypothetical protein|nr:hypothetical protein [Prevotellaceae bacterium]